MNSSMRNSLRSKAPVRDLKGLRLWASQRAISSIVFDGIV